MAYTDFQTDVHVVGVRTSLRGTYLILSKPPVAKPGYEVTVRISDEQLKGLKGVGPAAERMP